MWKLTDVEMSSWYKDLKRKNGFGVLSKKDREIIENLVNEKIQDHSCCDFGEYSCQLPMPINGKVQYIDACIAKYVAALNAAGLETIASCCGHNKIDGSIIIKNGDEFIIKINRGK